MLQFIKKNKANFIWVLIFGLMGLILRPLVNLLVNLSNEYPWVTRILLFLLLIACLLYSITTSLYTINSNFASRTFYKRIKISQGY